MSLTGYGVSASAASPNGSSPHLNGSSPNGSGHPNGTNPNGSSAHANGSSPNGDHDGHTRRRFWLFGRPRRERIVDVHEFRPTGEDVYKAFRY
ncbi:MAG TPA: hypothetical protein VGH10_11390 [Actinomycetota bacterium]